MAGDHLLSPSLTAMHWSVMHVRLHLSEISRMSVTATSIIDHSTEMGMLA